MAYRRSKRSRGGARRVSRPASRRASTAPRRSARRGRGSVRSRTGNRANTVRIVVEQRPTAESAAPQGYKIVPKRKAMF